MRPGVQFTLELRVLGQKKQPLPPLQVAWSAQWAEQPCPRSPRIWAPGPAASLAKDEAPKTGALGVDLGRLWPFPRCLLLP